MKWTSIAVLIALAAFTAPPAGADSNSVAVAINPKTQQMATQHGPDSASTQAKRALGDCNSNYDHCVLLASTTNGCIGIALAPPAYAYAIADNYTLAESKAVEKLPAIDPVAGYSSQGICSDGTSDGF
jgi:hypothetical protein